MKNLLIALLFMSPTYLHAQVEKYHSESLIPVAEFGKYQPIGVSVSSSNRLFVSFPHRKAYLYGLTEIIDGKRTPFPDKNWNKTDGDEKTNFVNVQDIYVDTKDRLWVLDSKPGASNSIFGKDPGGANVGKFKLIQIDLEDNTVKAIYSFDDLDKTKSALNDVRIDTDKELAYLSDPGQSAIVVLDLKTGKSRLALQNHKSTTSEKDFILSYEGHEMKDANGNPFKSNVNGIALTNDNKYFYYRPINTLHLYRIETKYLSDNSLTDTELIPYVQDIGETSVSHGMIADKHGNIYLTSSLDYSIKYVSPDGKLHTLVQDSRLIWPDSLGIGTDGYLYFSCAQVNRLPQWNNNVDKTSFPYQVYKVKLPNS